MDIKQVNEINKQLADAVKNEVEWMISRTDDNINDKLALQSKLTDLLRVLRLENGKQ